MGLDVKNNPFLYSVGTQLAYKIAKYFEMTIEEVFLFEEEEV